MNPTSPSADASVEVDLTLYSPEAVQKSAHRFTNRFYIKFEKISEQILRVHFVSKEKNLDTGFIKNEFFNELLDQNLRFKLAQATEPTRNLIIAHALSGLDLLHPELEEVNPASDPNQIGVPDKQKAKKL